ncbi:MAG: nitroreductase family protein, partial [Ilumatobacteraceae bacterium]
MELREAIRTNGSVRRFTDEPVPRDTVLGVLDDARFAPSGGNRQPWKVVIVEDLSQRRAVASLMQQVWDDYLETAATGGTPFNVVDYVPPATITPGKPNDLFDNIDTVPVVL